MNRFRQPGLYTLLSLVLFALTACGGEADRGVESSEAPGSDAVTETTPPPPPSSAFIALLSPDQTQEIRSLGVPLVVPTAIPSGFVVEQVMTSQDEQFTGYQILYRDGGDRCFLVEYASGGVGSLPATEYRLPINPPLVEAEADFGLNYGTYTDPALKAQFPEPELITDWLPLARGVARLAGAAYINDTLMPEQPCADIAPEEAVAIVESFAEITDDIVGDG